MFTDKEISMIFGNIEEIYEFQKFFKNIFPTWVKWIAVQLFSELETANNRTAIHLTQVGKIFLKNVSKVYLYIWKSSKKFEKASKIPRAAVLVGMKQNLFNIYL